jgi:hypothetical protein
MKTVSLLSIAAAAIAANVSVANIRITEVMSSSNGGGTPTPDFFEITNYGSSAVTLTGWKMDDNSFAIGSAVALSGITSIGAGETVVFIESAAGAAVSSFRSFWGGLAGVQVGYYSGSGVSLSSNGDSVVLFNSGNTEVTRVSFGAATSGSTFFWGYDAASGVVDSSYNGLVSTVGTIGSQVTFQSSGDTGSLGTAINAPAPGAVALLGVAGLLNGRRRR